MGNYAHIEDEQKAVYIKTISMKLCSILWGLIKKPDISSREGEQWIVGKKGDITSHSGWCKVCDLWWGKGSWSRWKEESISEMGQYKIVWAECNTTKKPRSIRVP